MVEETETAWFVTDTLEYPANPTETPQDGFFGCNSQLPICWKKWPKKAL